MVRVVSRAGLKALIEHPVDILAEPRFIDRRGVPERFQQRLARHEASARGTQFAYGDPVAGHHKVFAAVKGPQDRSAVVPQFPLADDLCHDGMIPEV